MTTPEYLQVVEFALAQRSSLEVTAMARMTTLWKQVQGIIEGQLESLIIAESQRLGVTLIPMSKLVTTERYLAFLQQTQALMSGLTVPMSQIVSQLAFDSATLSTAIAGQLLATIAGGAASSFSTLPVAQIIAANALFGPGGKLGALLANAYPLATEGLKNQLLSQIVLGKNPRAIAQFVGQHGLSQGLNHLLLVSRDQSNRIYRDTNRLQWQASGRVLAYRRIAAKKPNTCALCLALDGETVAVDEPMAVHPQDRCSMIPIVTGVSVPQFQLGADWLRDQPTSVQRSVLGSAFESWRDGADLAGLVRKYDSEWGPSLAFK